jgi:hypothetical protein
MKYIKNYDSIADYKATITNVAEQLGTIIDFPSTIDIPKFVLDAALVIVAL